jgi:HEAT repeat protein
MPRPLASLHAGALAFALLFLGSASASAQLELPKQKPKEGVSSPENKPDAPAPGAEREPQKPKPGSQGIVPHLVCVVCGEHNYISNFNRPQDDGTYLAHCSFCARDQKHARSKDVAAQEKLRLPGGTRRAASGPGAASQGGGLSSSRQRYGDGAAGFILRQIAEADDTGASIVQKGVESLLGLGEEGLVAARIVLHDEVPAVVVAAGSVLVRAGYAEDAERVVARLYGSTPGKSGALLLEELVKRNPVSASPALLVALLEHENKPLRSAALRHLRGRITAAELPLLKRALESSRADTRAYALDLLEEIDDPEVLDILLEHLDDHSSKVAGRVIATLAGFRSDRVELELLARALSSHFLLRENGYALLAILEREDASLRPILDDRHAEPLLAGLRSSLPFVRGACAAALAGIGYRSERPFETTWLDRDVTGSMIQAISGRQFHSDFTALQPRVLRRLRLLTGADLGTDGPRWAEWWVANRPSFYANRAHLKVAEGGESKLEVHFRGTGREAAAFSFFGAEAAATEAQLRAGAAEKLLLTPRECLDLLALMEREGVLGPQRPPGVRGSRGLGQREIEVVLDGRGKTFLFGSGRSEVWFEKLASALRDLRERNRWQRFPSTARFSSARDFWEEESGWWAGEHDERERGLRLKELIFASVKQLPPSQRNLALRELEACYELAGVAQEGDFVFLLDLLRDEAFYAERAERLVELALAAAARGAAADGAIARELGGQLIDLLLARFERSALSAMGRIARACGDEYLRELAHGERPILRAVAAAELSREPDAQDVALLLELLDDPEPVVEAAAVVALGEARVEAARTELLLRARLADPIVRAAALRAVGKLGGEYVLEALVLGVSDSDPAVKRGAAEGLAALGDPQSAPLLISLLRQGPEAEIFATARDGLLALGPAAKTDLLRVVASPAHQARRECALLLGAMSAHEVVPAMIQMVELDPADKEMAFELAVLTCFDARDAEDPPARWRSWYDGVTHSDSLAWLLAAMERRGIPVSLTASFDGGPGSREGALFLLEVLGGEQDFLLERARRELSRMFGADLGALPAGEAQRAVWLQALRETILERFEA